MGCNRMITCKSIRTDSIFSITSSWLLFSFCLSLLLSFQASAQQQAHTIEFRRLRQRYINTPSYKDSTIGAASSQNDWLQLIVEYETDAANGEWLNELSLEWHVALTDSSASKPALMHRTASYIDIKDGKHYAAVYIRPRFLERLYDKSRISDKYIRVFLEIKSDGKKFGEIHFPKQWDRKWWESDLAIDKSSELLLRSQTPYAPMDWDFYEYMPSDK